jgi:uncharacterized protein (DUF1697 family)
MLAMAAQSSGVHVALLRGINLGGRQVPMKELAAIFVEAKCREVRTYIQSGNVVFQTAAADAGRLAARVEKALLARFGFEVPVVTRSAAELRAVAGANPYLRAGADPGTLHVAFLAERPSPARVAALDPERSPPDRFTVNGSEIYLHCPKGYGNTKLTNSYFDAKLGTTSTVRNWKTVLTLLEMAGG